MFPNMFLSFVKVLNCKQFASKNRNVGPALQEIWWNCETKMPSLLAENQTGKTKSQANF